MKLSELAAVAGTTTATVKFYIRAGLLRAGAKKNQTTAVYGQHHVDRLELVLGVRERIHAPLEAILALTGVIDDPDAGLLEVMEAAQTLGAGGRMPPEESGAEPTAAGERAREVLAEVLTSRGWPDVDSLARAAVERRVAEATVSRYNVGGAAWDVDTLTRVAAAVETIGVMDLDVSGSRDRIALGVAVGTYELSQLVVDMLRLAQTSESIGRVSR